MKSLRQLQAGQLRSQNQNQNQVGNMKSYEYYQIKYENYQRKNTIKGWAFHIYLVCLSLLVKQPY